MLKSYEAVIKKGHITWLDTPPSIDSARVIITVLPKNSDLSPESIQSKASKRQLGFMRGEMTIPDDIHWGDEQVSDLFGF